MEKNYREGFTYQEFANDLTAEFFDPLEWAELFEKSGARCKAAVFIIKFLTIQLLADMWF